MPDFAATDLTICIPAFNAAGFIDRTIGCAQDQTYPHVRILISVDRSEDDTAAICRAFAANDRRIEVIEQSERLGWAGNLNRLLERVETPFFFTYFHDDLIAPQYCETLRAILVERPELASTHCDVELFGDLEAHKPGADYEGPLAQRLISLWATPRRGSPLRSMVRSERVGADYRLSERAVGSFLPGLTLLMRMMAAGPAARCPQTLYRRWQRKGGLTDGWNRLPLGQLVEGWAAEIADAAGFFEHLPIQAADRSALKSSLVLYAMSQMARRRLEEGLALPAPEALHPEVSAAAFEQDFTRFGPVVEGQIQAYRRKVAAAVGP